METKYDLDEVLEKISFWKTVRVTTWIRRFLNNCKRKKSTRLVGPPTTSETDEEVRWWVQRVQESSSGTEKFDPQPAKEQRRVERVPRQNTRKLSNLFTTECSVVIEVGSRCAHADVTWESWPHNGVIRRDYWIPRLRQLTKKIIKGYFGCKKFQAKAFGSPPPGNLPIDRTMGSVPFQVLGVDYAGPILHRISKKRDVKLISCYLSVV